jgi:uncharacterized protein YqfA (UPF0365 family)
MPPTTFARATITPTVMKTPNLGGVPVTGIEMIAILEMTTMETNVTRAAMIETDMTAITVVTEPVVVVIVIDSFTSR